MEDYKIWSLEFGVWRRSTRPARLARRCRREETLLSSVRGALFLLLGVCVGGFVGMVVLGCGNHLGNQVLGVRAAKTTIERVREFGVLILIYLFDFTYHGPLNY